MPRVKVEWHDVAVGALMTALLFTVGKTLIGLYIGKTGMASGFGAAGSIVIVLVWVYYSAQIFLMGAEFTWVYAHTFGSMKAAPSPASAVPAVPAASSIPSRGSALQPAPLSVMNHSVSPSIKLRPGTSNAYPILTLAAQLAAFLTVKLLLRRFARKRTGLRRLGR